MKSYPSIPTATSSNYKHDASLNYYVFDKLDGSNIRAEWNPKKGFYKFGSRNQLLSTEQAILYPAIDKINNFIDSNGKKLNEYLKNITKDSVVCFFEYYGPKSFCGNHYDNVENMKVTLIDVSIYKKGFLSPSDFFNNFKHFDIPKILYNGKIKNIDEFFDSVAFQKLSGITFEGVVVKEDKNNGKMFKVKTDAWLASLYKHCKNEEEFEKLK